MQVGEEIAQQSSPLIDRENEHNRLVMRPDGCVVPRIVEGTYVEWQQRLVRAYRLIALSVGSPRRFVEIQPFFFTHNL